MLFSDFLHVVHLVVKETLKFHYYANLLELIQSYLVKDWNIPIRHILIKENFWAYIFGKIGANLNTSCESAWTTALSLFSNMQVSHLNYSIETLNWSSH